MPDLRLAFWNVGNLFEAGVVPRGPQSLAERDKKIEQVSEQINDFHGGAGPDIIGLVEVGTDAIFEAIRNSLNGHYLPIWVPPGLATQTGIGLLARTPACADLELIDTHRPTMASRPRVMLVRVTLEGVDEPFLLAVNHWKSRMQHAGVDDAAERMESSRWLGDLLAAEDRTTAVVVLGDFNAEPFEPPFNELGIRGRRHFSSALWSQATPAYLYNTAWRSMTEPSQWEDRGVPNYKEPRPKTSHDDSPGVIFDQLLVSGRALRNGPIVLQEQTVRYHWNADIGVYSSTGVLRPRRWSYANADSFEGASDHFPLLATFDY